MLKPQPAPLTNPPFVIPSAIWTAAQAHPRLADAFNRKVSAYIRDFYAHEEKMRAVSGVHFSGMEPDPFHYKGPDDLLAEAQAEHDRWLAWRETPEGKFSEAITDVYAAIVSANVSRNQAYEAKCRSFPGELPRISKALIETREHLRAALEAVGLAEEAVALEYTREAA